MQSPSTKITSTHGLMQGFLQQAKAHDLTVDVLGDGAFGCEIAIVGEAPGEREVATKIPFSGGSGRVLWNVLRQQGYTRGSLYVTNVVKRQLSSSASEKKASIHKNELAMWESLVRWELEQLPNLRLVVLLGNYALGAIVGEHGIKNWRGSVFESSLIAKQVKCLATYNPAMVIYDPNTEIMFNFDLGKIGRVMTGKYKKHEITAHYDMSFKEAMSVGAHLYHEGLKGARLAFDIETMSNETACIGLTDNIHEGWCFNFRGSGHNLYTVAQERQLRRLLGKILSHPGIKLVAQNGAFDSYWLWYKDRMRVNKIWFDTLLAHHCLYPTLPHSLGALTTQYTDHPYYKDEGKEWRETGEIIKFWTYNVKDVCIALTVQQELLNELTSANLTHFFFNHVMAAQPHLIRATVLGVKCDSKLKSHLISAIREDVVNLEHKFHEKVIEAVGDADYIPNPNSPKQLMELFFRKLRLIGRGMSTDAENRERIKKHPRTRPVEVEMLNALDQFKEEHKFLTTYAEMIVDEDERIRCEYKQFGTQTAPGRLSSTKVMWGSGMNLQNQPERARSMFVADPGYGFGYFDLSQAEARYVAWDADIKTWIEQFERARIDGSYDAHRALASDMFNVPYDEVPTKDRNADWSPTIRYIAKRCRHGLNYRMGADKLATVTGLPSWQAQEAYNIYHNKTPELRVWWDRITHTVREKRVLFNSLGRRLLFLNRLTDMSGGANETSALDSIIAFRPQSTIGDKVVEVWRKSESDPEWPVNARICLNIHDALIVIAPIVRLMKCIQIMKRYAEEPIIVESIVSREKRPMIIPAETKISYPTIWNVNDEGKLEFTEDRSGLHRWSHMRKVEVTC